MLTTEFVPAADASSKRLLVVLHGLGDSMDGWRWLPGELGLPWMNYLLVNAPQEYFGGYSWFGLGIPQVNGGRLTVESADVAASRQQLHALLDSQRAAGWASDQTSILGFSQGCLMTLDAGLRYPERLAALVGISGWVHEPARLLAERGPHAAAVPVLVTHGAMDEVVPMTLAEPGVRQLQAAGLDVAWQEFEKGHTVAGRAEVGFIRRFLEGVYHQPAQTRRGNGPAEG